jgi:hypothetical protein
MLFLTMKDLFFLRSSDNNPLIQQCVENYVHKEQYVIKITKEQLKFSINDFFTCIDDYTEEKINHSIWITFINKDKPDYINYKEWNLIPLNSIYGPLHLQLKGLSFIFAKYQKNIIEHVCSKSKLYEVIKKSWDTNNGGYNLGFWYNPDHFGIDGNSNICKYYDNVVCKHDFKYDDSVDIKNFVINNNNYNEHKDIINKRNEKQKKNDLDDGDNLTMECYFKKIKK